MLNFEHRSYHCATLTALRSLRLLTCRQTVPEQEQEIDLLQSAFRSERVDEDF
jgi:hypothetical protein